MHIVISITITYLLYIQKQKQNKKPSEPLNSSAYLIVVLLSVDTL